MVVTERLGGALTTRGYLRDGEATARSFRGGAFLTGDLVSFDRNGNFVFPRPQDGQRARARRERDGDGGRERRRARIPPSRTAP